MGRPKAWLPFGDELMLQRVVGVLREVVEPVVVVAAPGQDVLPLPREVEIVRDEIEGLGPLGGLAAGLSALEGKADAAYLSSCDVPFLKVEFVRRIIELLGDASVSVPRVDGFHHPLASCYRITVLPHVHELLSANRLRPVFLFDALPTRVIEADELADIDPRFDSLRNLNTPEEYEEALRELNSMPRE
ncbi:MAG: molybdenum cofactor guanylyltransferase [Planctomycetia bacterium]|nr:molybdenum cofactor guanylyltransferase [Planctomycetia bacterium]